MQRYPDVDPQQSFPDLEQQVLHRWKEERTFERSVEQRPAGEDGANEYVFYDGPPFANGLPHYGHLLTGFVKDIVPRYHTMRGRRVERRFGWDCHGLPAEQEAEKVLGVKGGKEIAALGMAKFNDACRAAVLKYTGEWERYVTRQARWVDFTNSPRQPVGRRGSRRREPGAQCQFVRHASGRIPAHVRPGPRSTVCLSDEMANPSGRRSSPRWGTPTCTETRARSGWT